MLTHPDLLIVEDNPFILTSLLTFLVPFLLASMSELGALTTDICVPGAVNRVGLAMAARRRFPGLPVLPMTGFAPPDGLELARPPGHRLMMKPFRARTLIAQVMDMLGRLASWRFACCPTARSVSFRARGRTGLRVVHITG
jgi:hypothetical protein